MSDEEKTAEESEQDAEGHAKRLGNDDDAEGHVKRLGNDDDDDAEGHVKMR